MKAGKLLGRAVITMLCAVFVFGGASCKADKTPPSKSVAPEKAAFEGTHILTASESPDKWLIKDGITEYSLVIPADASATLKGAKDEFVLLFSRATGLNIPVYTDDEVPGERTEIISLGETVQMKNSELASYDTSELTDYGVRILTSGDAIYLLSGCDEGLFQAVYCFMRLTFHFETYYRNCVYIDTGVADLKLKLFDVTDIPDIPLLIADNRHYDWTDPIGTDTLAGMTAQDTKYQRARLGYSISRVHLMLPVLDDGNAYYDHSIMHFIPRDEDYSSYFQGEDLSNLWYADSGSQACYNAHGNAEALDALIRHCADKVINSLIAYPVAEYPYRNMCSITQSDGIPLCQCETCQQVNARDGGTPTGAMIRFNNRIRALVQEWMEQPGNEPYRRDDLVIMFFAYGDSIKAPVVEENGAYRLVNQDCEMDAGTGVFYAANLDFCFNKSIYEDVNALGRENMAMWSSITDNLWFWTYGTYYRATLYMCDTFNYFDNDAFRYMASQNVKLLFNESQDYGDGATGWANLKDYVQGKLAWNVNADAEALVEDFFEHMYGPAADAMYEAFMQMRLYYASMLEKHELNPAASYYNVLDSKEYFGLNTLQSWVEMFDAAIDALAPIRTADADAYEVYKSRIALERISPLTAIIRLYGNGEVDAATMKEYKNTLYEILTLYPEVKYAANNDSNLISMFD